VSDPAAPRPFVSRAGLKLDHAIRTFGVAVEGRRAADLGCNVGGFTDCLLRHGAASVISVDTAYGVLDWRLRSDPRVEARERTNALHAAPPHPPVDLVVVDLGWTPQRLALPVAARWIHATGEIVSLFKPHYELQGEQKAWLDRGRLEASRAHEVLKEFLPALPDLGLALAGSVESPIRGGKSARGGEGNVEFLLHLRRA
jgi:23S rRNA (cytidine1920-2'-O)/16S rRNA (cytidine1409-2'-O)-methyltransferase